MHYVTKEKKAKTFSGGKGFRLIAAEQVEEINTADQLFVTLRRTLSFQDSFLAPSVLP